MIKRIIALAIIVPLVIVGMLILTVWALGHMIEQAEQSPGAKSAQVVLPPTPNQVEVEINEWRISQGLATFNSEVPALDQAAQVRADTMCIENDWSHAKDWTTLSQYYAYSYAGENLYYGSLHRDQAEESVVTWAASPGHLANLQTNYSQIGVGVKHCPGFQDNPNAVIITNYFGVPR